MRGHNDSQLRETIVRTAKTHKYLLAIVAALVFLQFYFVRELIAAEFVFAAGFSVFLVVTMILYVVGAIAERSLEWSEAGVKVTAHSTHRLYNRISSALPIVGDVAKLHPEIRRKPDADF
jgi:hypothetical protein